MLLCETAVCVCVCVCETVPLSVLVYSFISWPLSVELTSRASVFAFALHLWGSVLSGCVILFCSMRLQLFTAVVPSPHPLFLTAQFAPVWRRTWRTFLVVQWLGGYLPVKGTQVRSLDWKAPTCCGATKPRSHNYWACVREPVCCTYWSLSATTTEPHPRACAPQQEKSPQGEAHMLQQK